MFGRVTVQVEMVRYCRRDKLSAEGPFGSGTAEDKELRHAQQWLKV